MIIFNMIASLSMYNWWPDVSFQVTSSKTVLDSGSLRNQPTFGDAATDFPSKWRLRNERTNSIMTTRYYPDLGSASDWSRRS